jgi:ABC-type glycerol-3-phosphate transport system permease component
MKKRKPGYHYFKRTLLHVVLGVGAIGFVFPFVWMILSSFMTNQEITASPITLVPGSLYFGNFQLVFHEIPIMRSWLNSLITAGLVVFFVLFSSSIAGFMFAKMKFKGNNTLFTLVLSSLLFPAHVILIPLYLLASRLKLLDSYAGIVLPFLISGFGVFLLRQFIYGIPDSLIDAARIDGASNIRIYLQIILPLVRPILSALGILIFVWTYDELLWPLTVINSNEMKTIPVVLGHFTRAHGQYPGASMAAAALVVVPVIIVYLFFQRNFTKGMSMTGTKY